MNDDLEQKIEEMRVMLKVIAKTWSIMRNSLNSWDFNAFKTSIENLNSNLNAVDIVWEILKDSIVEKNRQDSKQIGSDEYIFELEKCLREQNLQVQGNYPEYTLPPYKLVINNETSDIKLFFGRKIEKTTIMKPDKIALWVSDKHKNITKKKFDVEMFMNELIETYKIINKLTYREKDVIWGKAVKILDLYNILTIKKSTKMDYPKLLYMYELAQLKEFSEMVYNDFKFEFGFARDPSKAIIIVDSKGIESRISSLTIYKEGK